MPCLFLRRKPKSGPITALAVLVFLIQRGVHSASLGRNDLLNSVGAADLPLLPRRYDYLRLPPGEARSCGLCRQRRLILHRQLDLIARRVQANADILPVLNLPL